MSSDRPLRTVAHETAFYTGIGGETLRRIARRIVDESEEAACTPGVGLLRDRYANAVGVLAALLEEDERSSARTARRDGESDAQYLRRIHTEMWAHIDKMRPYLDELERRAERAEAEESGQ